MLFQYWSTVFDAGPTLKQHQVNAVVGQGPRRARATSSLCRKAGIFANSHDSRPTQLQTTPQVGLYSLPTPHDIGF